jgi:(1->4)-alpha-D-glucan 1-alpha-D-glucosylmutase
LLKLTSPGIPDIYQGNELLEFSLVDPDNRRRVDFQRREQIFELLPRDSADSHLAARARDLLSTCKGNAAKMYVTWKTLNLRREHPDLFQRGSYTPLNAAGELSQHVVAFARQHHSQTVVVAVPRLCGKLMGETSDSVCEDALWKDTSLEIPSAGVSCYHNLFTGECLPLKAPESSQVHIADLFRNFPVAILVGDPVNPSQDCGQK